MDLSRYLTTAAVARQLGVSLSRVRQLVRDRRLRSTKIGRDHYFRPADVKRVTRREYTKKPTT